MRGKWIYVAFAALLGTMAAFNNLHPAAIVACLIYLVWISFRDNSKVRLFLICAFTICSFALLFMWVDDHNVSNLTGAETEFKGIITTIPVIDGDRISFNYTLPSKEKLIVAYRIKTIEERNRMQALEVGMSCNVTGTLTVPDKARNFYAFDYQKFLYTKHIHWILQPDSLNPSRCLPSSSFKFLLKKWRSTQLSYIKNHFPENTIGFVQALIFGDRNEISQTIEEDFQQFGLIHLLAISGSHVVLIVAVIFYLLVRIGITRERAFLSLFITLPFYMIIAGGTPSVVRACLVAMLVLASIQWKTRFLPLDAISLVLILMLVVNPYYISDIGFQLSFLVSFSLILSSAKIIPGQANNFKQLVIVTSIAQLSSLPLILFYNYEISLLSLPLNFIFVPLMSIIILPVSIFSFLYSYLSAPLAAIPISFLSMIIEFSIRLLEQTEKFSTFTFTFGKPDCWLVIVYYAVIVYFFKSWEERKTTKKAVWLLLSALLFHWFQPYFWDEGKVTIIDVGQGDSILIELPFRKAVYLIDTGGTTTFTRDDWQIRKNRYDVGEDIISPLLKAKGIRTIDKLILTHGDFDHIGGTAAVLKHFKVKEVIIGAGKSGDNEEEVEKELFAIIAAKNISVKTVKTGNHWENAGFSFYVLGPSGNEKSINDQSVVLYSQLGGFRWLFTGDLEEEGENRVLSQFPNLQVDVVKIGHHGSKTSTSQAFVEQINPKIALISVGKKNRFGHPHQAVIQTLTERSVAILRTDENGSICYKFIGNKGTFEWLFP